MATKRPRLKLAKPKRISKLSDIENRQNLNSPEDDCIIIQSELKGDEGIYCFEAPQTIKDERLKELREKLEIVAQTFRPSSFIPFPSLVVNNQKDLSINENAIFDHPQWTPFPSACVECTTDPLLSSSEINHDSQPLNRSHSSPSPETFSLFPSSFQTNQSHELWNERSPPLSPEIESPSKMQTNEFISSPDLFGQVSSENQKFQPKQRTFQSSNSKILFPETSSGQTTDLSKNQETASAEKPIRSCPLCQESFPSQMSQFDIDEHIAGCLSATADDDDINW